MDSCDTPSPPLDRSPFSSVLRDIFEQTRGEIQARSLGQHDVNIVAEPDYFGASSSRFGPLSDPALSYIYDIFGEEEEEEEEGDARLEPKDPSLSYGELVAYKAKATEVAAILKEDSPSLSLNMSNNLNNGGSCVGSSSKLPVTTTIHTMVPSFMTTCDTVFPQEGQAHLFGNSSANSLKYFDPHVPIKPIRFESLGDEVLDMSRLQSSSHFDMVWDGGADTTPTLVPLHRHDNDHHRRHHHHQKKGNLLKLRKESGMALKRCSSGTRKGRGASKNCDCEHKYVDINDLLLQCAQAAGMNNTKSAMEILERVKQHVPSPYGSGTQRLAYYFAEAMDARFSGTGWPLYMGGLRCRPSSADILKATCKYMESCPFAKASHYFINQTILNVAKGASKLHILELQTTGFQYPSLFKALAARPEGPPHVRLIGVGFPHYSMLPAQTEVVLEALQRSGSQLSECAASFHVPFQFTAWAGAREDLRMQDFVTPVRNPGEVLVVISAYLLRYVMDDTLDSPMARSKLLKMGRDVNPDVYIQGIVTGSYSTPFFTRRFREALFHFESVYDMLDTFIERENTDRVVFESEILGKAILNIVACEGMDVVERVDKYKHWQAVTEEVGFQQLLLNEEIRDKVHVMLKSWHKEYTVAEDSQYLLMGWKGRMLHAMSTWKARSLEGSF